MKLSQQALRITRLTLIAMCVLSSGLMVYEWVRPYGLSANPPLISPDKEVAVAAPETQANRPVPPLGTFSEMIERPLFREDRSPYVPETPTEPEQPRDTGPDITTQISLSAIVIDEDERIALIERTQDKKLQQLRQGEKFNGWTLNQIQADDITMQKGQQTRQIALTVKLLRQTVQQPKNEKSEDVEKQSNMASPANSSEDMNNDE